MPATSRAPRSGLGSVAASSILQPCTLGGNASLVPVGRPMVGSRILDLAWSVPRYGRYLESESADGGNLWLWLPVFQINTNNKKCKKKVSSDPQNFQLCLVLNLIHPLTLPHPSGNWKLKSDWSFFKTMMLLLTVKVQPRQWTGLTHGMQTFTTWFGNCHVTVFMLMWGLAGGGRKRLLVSIYWVMLPNNSNCWFALFVKTIKLKIN